MVLAVIIFCFTYMLIAARRLSILPIGRSAGALLGALLMVFCGIVSPEESYAAINHDTILLLFGTMLLTVYLSEANFFEILSLFILKICKTPLQMLILISILAAIFSAFLVNDTICLFMTPIIINLCIQNKLPMIPYLVALATSANIGSMATLVGNPQNMIIASYSNINFTKFFVVMLPVTTVCLSINILLLYFFYNKHLPKKFVETSNVQKSDATLKFYVTLFVVLLIIGSFFSGFHLGYSVIAGCLILIIFERKDPQQSFAQVNWSLLILFCGLFIVTHAVAKTGLIESLWQFFIPNVNFANFAEIVNFVIFMAVGSQAVSNVPMVLLSAPYFQNLGLELAWFYLAFSTTIAGNLTLLGSVANIIVAEIAQKHCVLGFWEYFKFGIVSTIINLAVGTLVIYSITYFF